MVATSLRCAAWARSQDLNPIGSAGSYRGFLLVELPLPWPRDVSEVPLVASLKPLTDRLGMRVQAVLDPTAKRTRVLAHLSARGEGFAGFVRREIETGDDPGAEIEALLRDTSPPAPGKGKDLLVCTHGRRDVCCGSLGTDLATSLADNGSLPDGVNLWRTSHTGGHRFAPTFIVLPEATLWAFADPPLVDQVLNRSGRVAEVADRYRGCAGVGGSQVQAAEREVLRQVGWDLLDLPRRGEVLEGGRVRLTVGLPDGGAQVWEAEVAPGRTLPVPDCGRPIEEAKKSETEWVATGLRLVAG